MSDFKLRRCRECGEGMVRPPREGGSEDAVPEHVRACRAQHARHPDLRQVRDEWIDPKTAEALDEALQGVYADELHKRLEAALVTILASADVSQRRLEQVLGLSVGYLSRLRTKRGDASAQLVSAFVLIAEDPKRRLSALDHVWQPEA